MTSTTSRRASRHKLPFTNVMTESAHMNDLAGPYKGLSREACRKKIVAEDLEAAEMH
jgi:valyl-tRNA synthetase